jgi:hypothetical protein
VFKEARFIRNSFSVLFPRQRLIRRKANDLEDHLKHSYSPPQTIPIPDEFDPQVPRLIFGSEHGFSQIVVSQISISLNVTYSPDWQTDINEGREYLAERVSLLFESLQILDGVRASFCGQTTTVRLATDEADTFVIGKIASWFSSDQDITETHELRIKKANVIDNRFFNNLTLSNYRVWTIPSTITTTPRVSSENVKERGLEVVGDFNDRYAYNEREDYNSNIEVAQEVISNGLNEVERLVSIIQEL